MRLVNAPVALVDGMDLPRRDLEADGFTHLRGVFHPRDLREVEAVLDALLVTTGSAALLARRRDLSEVWNPGIPRQPEILRPSLAVPRLRRTSVYFKCRDVAAALLGCRAHYLFDHAIYKMPRSETHTPWHQDLAYLGEFAHGIRSLHFWIPLQDTTVEGGALMFVPGSHRWPLLEHVPAYERNPHVLMAASNGFPTGCCVPLEYGDASIHTHLTLHAAGPNRTDGIRKAWIVHFGDVPVWHKHVLKFRDRVRRHWVRQTRRFRATPAGT